MQYIHIRNKYESQNYLFQLFFIVERYLQDIIQYLINKILTFIFYFVNYYCVILFLFIYSQIKCIENIYNKNSSPDGPEKGGRAISAPLFWCCTTGHRAVSAPDISVPFPNLFLFFEL